MPPSSSAVLRLSAIFEGASFTFFNPESVGGQLYGATFTYSAPQVSFGATVADEFYAGGSVTCSGQPGAASLSFTATGGGSSSASYSMKLNIKK